MSRVGPAGAAYYRPAEVARMLRCSEWWVKEQARRRRIPFCWIGGSYLFTEEHIVAIVRLFEKRPTGDADPQVVDVPSDHRARGQANDAAGVRLRARPPRSDSSSTSAA